MEDNLNIVNLVEEPKKQKYKGVIGTLKGIFADMNHPTRNGRQYTKACWEQALNSDDVKEKLETRTMFGELDHPPERLETLQERAAIITTKLEMNDKDGVIMGEADILDTPFGRILKTFIDAGVKVGISSRGAGEETMKEGVNQIIPDTFYLETFDIVSMPAVKSARLSLVESKNRNIITEAFAREIQTAKSSEQVDELLEYAKNRNIANFAKLEEDAKNVKNSFGENTILPENKEGDNIDVSSEVISQLEEELNVSNTKYESLEALCEKMKNHSIKTIKELKECQLVNEQLTKQVEDFIKEKDNNITQLESYKASNNFLKSKLNESKVKVESLEKEINTKISEAKMIKSSLETENKKLSNSLECKVESLEKENTDLQDQLSKSKSLIKESNSKLEELSKSIENYKLENKELTIKLEESKLENTNKAKEDGDKINSLNESLEEANKLIENLKAQLESKTNENTKLVKESRVIKESYLNKITKSNGIKKEELNLNENYSISDIDKKVNIILENRRNLNRLPFNTNSILNEAVSLNIKDSEVKEENSSLKKMAKKVGSTKI